MTLVRYLAYQYVRIMRRTAAGCVKDLREWPEDLDRRDSVWATMQRQKRERQLATYEAEVARCDEAMAALLRGERLRDAMREVMS